MNAAVDGKGKPASVSLLLKSLSRRPKRTRSDAWRVANGGAGPNRIKHRKEKRGKSGPSLVRERSKRKPLSKHLK